jgi:hypothetical protein
VAIEDALQLILSEWPDIEPLLTVSELTALASISRVTMRGAGSGRSEAVFRVIAAALSPGHAAWPALRDQFDHGFRSRPGTPPDVDLIDRAGLALDNPLSAVDAVADALAAESRAALLQFGALEAGPDAEGGELWLSIRIDDQMFYPLFQFASTRPYRQYEIVAGLRQQLGADDDPTGAAAWWLTPNPWLSARPAELLGTEREPEVAYAADQLANDSW